MYNWKKYNNKSDKLSLEFDRHNNKNFFNKIENSYYNHTRDLFCLSLLRLNKKNNICLDYGSNKISISNIKNKIDPKKYKFIIYNPFLNKKSSKKIKNISYIEINDLNVLKSKIDFLNFGSSLQYIKEPLKILKKLRFNKKALILITATPFTLGTNYVSSQRNHENLRQNIINFHNIIRLFKKNRFKLIFKSSMNLKEASIKNKKKDTFFLNLLLEKN